MLDITFAIFLLLFSVACFFEFLVFNEEALLALCFFAFVFFCFNSLSNSIFDSFDSRALKFESEFLVAFNLAKQMNSKIFYFWLNFRAFPVKFQFLLTAFKYCLSFLEVNHWSSRLTALSGFFISVLTEVAFLESLAVKTYQKNSAFLHLYPFICYRNHSNQLVNKIDISASSDLSIKYLSFLTSC